MDFQSLEQLIELVQTNQRTVGIDVRKTENDSEQFYQLRKNRKQARANERRRMQLAEQQIVELSEWQPVYQQAIYLLENAGLDIEVTCYLIEAAVRLAGFHGLAQTLLLLNSMLSQYGLTLQPHDAEQPINQFSALQSLNGDYQAGSLIMPIKCVPITASSCQDNFSTWQYEAANNGDLQQTDNSILDIIKLAASETKAEFYQTMLADIESCLTQLDAIDSSISNLCHEDLSLSCYIREALKTVQNLVRELISQSSQPVAGNDSAVSETDCATEVDTVGLTDSVALNLINCDNKIKNRDAAIALLQQIADFFKKSEPHSPISYSLEKAIQWSHMELPELIQSLIDDPQAYLNYCRITGINANPPGREPFAPQEFSYDPACPAENDVENFN